MLRIIILSLTITGRSNAFLCFHPLRPSRFQVKSHNRAVVKSTQRDTPFQKSIHSLKSTRQTTNELSHSEYTYKQVLVTDPVSTELALLSANRAFYAAFRSGDFEAMANALHPDDEQVSVVHPGIPPLYGRKAVLQSWRAVLASPPSVFPSEARVVQIHDDIAWLHCFESLDGTDGVKLAATNIFKRDSEGIWRIVLHHAGSCCI
mmetsp:Transcript_3405/g.4763  ORF Transcript_3405/g.4763 Transcript_3405/m.4763 type:complete len:205 (+) Transcript_3405:70-684(+)